MNTIQSDELQQHMLPAMTLIEMFANGTYGTISKTQQVKIESIKYYFDQLIDTLENEIQKENNLSTSYC